jgi:hypothetical protein
VKGEIRKRRYFKRRTWGRIRSKLRQRFSKGNYEVEPEYLRPEKSCYGSWDPSRMRWQFKHHHERYAKNIPFVSALLYGMKGNKELLREYGLGFLECIQCGENEVRHIDEKDQETFGLCHFCASPILERRRHEVEERRAARSRLLARSMLPREVIQTLDAVGYLEVRTELYTYLLSYRGTLYNATTGQHYCVHPNVPTPDWDRVILFWLLLKNNLKLIEERAHKRLEPIANWKKLYSTGRIKIQRR